MGMMKGMTPPESDDYDEDDEPEPAAVSSRASGRPPEEESSEDPEHQARGHSRGVRGPDDRGRREIDLRGRAGPSRVSGRTRRV